MFIFGHLFSLWELYWERNKNFIVNAVHGHARKSLMQYYDMYRPDYMRMPMEKHILSVYVTFSARMDYVGIYALNDGNCGGALSNHPSIYPCSLNYGCKRKGECK